MTERDPLDVEQARVRAVALVVALGAALFAVVALGLALWLWAIGGTALAAGATFWALRMYAAQEDRRAQLTAQGGARRAYADPFATRPEGT